MIFRENREAQQLHARNTNLSTGPGDNQFSIKASGNAAKARDDDNRSCFAPDAYLAQPNLIFAKRFLEKFIQTKNLLTGRLLT